MHASSVYKRQLVLKLLFGTLETSAGGSDTTEISAATAPHGIKYRAENSSYLKAASGAAKKSKKLGPRHSKATTNQSQRQSRAGLWDNLFFAILSIRATGFKRLEVPDVELTIETQNVLEPSPQQQTNFKMSEFSTLPKSTNNQ